MNNRRAIGPDQIQHGNKIECHVAGSCATYLDADLNWQISNHTQRQHLLSPSGETTGREVWTQRPLTVGVNTYGTRQDLITIRESSTLGKHTEWTITPIDPYYLRRKSQPASTEYDLDEQVVQATSNNTTRIFTPYDGQASISYEITAPPGGEIRRENGQLNAYRDNWYLFTIAEPTVYDADKRLIRDAEGLPVRCYSIRLETVSAEDGVYIVHKELCGDVPNDCAWVDVEISSTNNGSGKVRSLIGTDDTWSYYRDSATGRDFVDADSCQTDLRAVTTATNNYVLNRGLIAFAASGTTSAQRKKVFLKVFIEDNAREEETRTFAFQRGTQDPDSGLSVDDYSAFDTPLFGTLSLSGEAAEGQYYLVELSNIDSYIDANSGKTTIFIREYEHDYLNVEPTGITETTYWGGYPSGPSGSNPPILIIDIAHTGDYRRANIVGSIPSGGGVVQVDFDGSDPAGLDIANNLSDTSGATDVHFRTVDASGDPDALIPFQRLSASGSGSSFAYSAKLDMPAGVTDFCVCYGPNNPPSSDYVDFSSTVSGTAINTGEEEPGEGFWDWYSSELTVNHYTLGITSVDAINLYPDRSGYNFGNVLIRDDNRLDNGNLETYIQAKYERFEMSLWCVSSQDAMIVNSWWETGTELLFFVTSDSTVEVNSVMIMGDECPFQQFHSPYEDRYNGNIVMETY